MECNLKKVELTGTSSIYNCDSIVVYNTMTFQDLDLIKSLGIEDPGPLCNPSSKNIESIYTVLMKTGYYDVIKEKSKGEFEFDNFKYDPILGEGFDIIICLEKDKILGFAWLSSPCGYVKHTRGDVYDIKREYSMRTVLIRIENSNPEGEDILTEGIELKFLHDIPDSEGGVRVGVKNHEYLKSSTALSTKRFGYGTYSINVNSVLKERGSKTIITDTGMFKVDRCGNLKASRLKIRPNLKIPEYYTQFQVGYYQGDIVLYAWNRTGDFTIYSLTRTLGDIFGDSSLDNSPYPYTSPRESVSDTEIYNIPGVKISYFSGRYAIVLNDLGEELLFDTTSWKYINPGLSFLVDRFDVRERVRFYNTALWTSFGKCIETIPELSDTYINSKVAIFSNLGMSVSCKFGDWIKFYYPVGNGYYLYSNMSKAVLTSSLDKVIVINDQVLLVFDGAGYTLYDSPGYYISESAAKGLFKGKDLVSPELYGTGTKWSIEKNKKFTISSEEHPCTLASSPIAPFRRGLLPKTLTGLNLIGAIGGIIFYRQENTINYL